MSTSDETPDATLSALQDDMLHHYGRRFFAEAQNVSAEEAAELAAWKRGHIDQRKWWQGGSASTPASSHLGASRDPSDGGTNGSDPD